MAGVLLNIASNRFCIWAGIPLYLDTVFTISVTMVSGLFWGCLCGALTNLITTTFSFWGAYLFALCSIATAVITWLFTRLFSRELYLGTETPGNTVTLKVKVRSRRLTTVMDRMIALILLSFALCLAMSILGGFIAGFIQIVNPSLTDKWGISVWTISMFSENLPIILREILSRIPINIVDRLVSVFAGFGAAVLIRKVMGKLAVRN